MDGSVSEWGLTLATMVFGALWTAFRSSDVLGRVRDERFRKALSALEAGVEQTYRTYVRALKESRADGKLTDEERRQARLLARDTAMAFGRTQGVDVLQTLGREYIDVWIAKLVNGLKIGAGLA